MKRINRRRSLAAFSSSAFAFTAGCRHLMAPASECHPVSEFVTSWPTFRGGRYNTGYIGDVSPLDSESSVEWTFEASDTFWGGPIVIDGTVYIGSADSALYALDAETGEERWSFEAGHQAEGMSVYADGVVYVGLYDKHLYMLDAGTGEERWSHGFGDLIRGSPTVWDDTVYIGVGCRNLACAWYAEEANVSGTGWVYALDAETGETEWRYEAGDEVVSTPAVTNNRVYVGTSDEALHTLLRSVGEVEWTYEIRDTIRSSPTVAYGSVCFTDWNGNVRAADAVTGEQEWFVDMAGRYISGSIVVGEEAVYVGRTPYNMLDDPMINHVRVFRSDRESGVENWSFEMPVLEAGSNPTLTESVFYVGTHRQSGGDDVDAHAITTDGQEEWFMEIDRCSVGSSLALVDGRLYFGGTDAKVHAVE